MEGVNFLFVIMDRVRHAPQSHLLVNAHVEGRRPLPQAHGEPLQAVRHDLTRLEAPEEGRGQFDGEALAAAKEDADRLRGKFVACHPSLHDSPRIRKRPRRVLLAVEVEGQEEREGGAGVSDD